MERDGGYTQTLCVGPSNEGPADLPPHESAPIARDLSREFDAPAGLLDPAARAWRVRVGAGEEAFPDAADASIASAGPFDEGRAIVWRPDPDAGGPAWLGLPVPRPDAPRLVAWVGFAPAPDSPPGPWGPSCPEPALRAWGQAVADRLRAEAGGRLASALGPGMAREHPIQDRLVRRLRVNDPPERFQRLATQALRDVLAVEAVAWVPGHSREPVVVAGAVAGLDAEAFRALVQSSSAESVRVINRPNDPRSAVRKLVVVSADPESPAGWLLALNPSDDRPFASAEVEVLQPVASLVGTQRSNARLYADLKDLLFGVIRSLTSAIDAKDPYTSGHSERVARIAVRLGEALGMSAHTRGDLYLMGLLHDVGKIGIDDGVLKKRGSLTPEEYRVIQSHVRIGVHILSDLKKLHHLLPGVAYHHESLDGTGYPSGLSGEAIPLPARILAVADAFDAMSSTRPYRRRLPPETIDEIFRKGAGVQWDAKVVDALFSCRADLERIRQKGLGESLQQAVGDALGRT